MSNILDYLQWRGDLSFKQATFNNLDSLILCRLAYLPFKGIIPADFAKKTISLGEACQIRLADQDFSDEDEEERREISENDQKLMLLTAQSQRFSSIEAFGHVNQVDYQAEMQFSATTFLLSDFTMFVAFRGTDNTLVGWKEDFNMTFQDVVPAQKEALAYLNKAASSRRRKIRAGGHSKGGNLAVFSSAFTRESIQRRILNIYNFDGPGFSRQTISSPGFRRIAPKIETFIPQSSIFGLMFEHDEEYTVIHSNESGGLMQHHIYSWETLRDNFVLEAKTSESSRFFHLTLRDWVSSLSIEKREKIIDALYNIFVNSDAKIISDLYKLDSLKIILKSIRNLDNETKGLIREASKILAKSMSKALPITIEDYWRKGDSVTEVPAKGLQNEP